jgi:hypothetical protein
MHDINIVISFASVNILQCFSSTFSATLLNMTFSSLQDSHQHLAYFAGEVLPKAHLTAVLGATGPLRLYWNWDNVAKDGNLLPTILLDYISRVKAERGSLPPVLYLQLDNTARENKNKFVMTFLALLVERGVFEKIKVNFLLVGHTHEVLPI